MVCTGNICRSPMAAAVLERDANQKTMKLAIASAGIAARVGAPATEDAVALMDERGLDISAHRGRQFSSELARPYELILVMEQHQKAFIEMHWPMFKGRVHGLGRWRDMEVADPFGSPRAAFEQSLEQIEAGLTGWAEWLWQ
jgi:protein-tyrosine phosphatase